jgi:hypothetical protein
MNYKNRDMRNFEARHETRKQQLIAVIGLVALLAVLGWLGERDHQDKLASIEMAKQCGKEG